jgi:hypothetical protein
MSHGGALLEEARIAPKERHHPPLITEPQSQSTLWMWAYGLVDSDAMVLLTLVHWDPKVIEENADRPR